GLLQHTLTDTATLNYNDTCDVGPVPPVGNCTTQSQTATAGSGTLIQGPETGLESSTTTQMHNASHQTVTTVEAGTAVHQFVAVTGQPGHPVPTGTVDTLFFHNGDCSADPSVGGGRTALDADGHADATAFVFTPAAGRFSFTADYSGDIV